MKKQYQRKAMNNEQPENSQAALNFEFSPPAQVPDRIMLLPAGPVIKGRDGRSWRLDDPQAIVEAFHANGADLPVDVEHSTEIKGPKGEPAPAFGWIKEIEVREGTTWGRVDWTNEGKISVGEREYRYISPVFYYDKQTKEILQLTSVALTNQPNLVLPALNREGTNKQQQTEDVIMLKKILAALGLAEGADEATALNAVQKLKGDLQTALNRAETPSLDKFVPRSDYDAAVSRATNAENALQESKNAEHDKAVDTAIDAALKAGKITPANKEFYVATCRTEEGLAAFNKFVESAPVVADKTGLDDKELDQNKGMALNADQQKIAGMFGNSADDLKKYGTA